MNERIKELKDEVLVWAIETLDPNVLNENEWGVAIDEKFAELIVRECADICINKNVSNLDLDVIRESGKFTLQDLATKSCGENLSKQIKQHFGVEE